MKNFFIDTQPIEEHDEQEIINTLDVSNFK